MENTNKKTVLDVAIKVLSGYSVAKGIKLSSAKSRFQMSPAEVISAVFVGYGIGKGKKGLAQDADKWITVHPNGPEAKGQPALIDGETGTVKAGMGWKVQWTEHPRGKKSGGNAGPEKNWYGGERGFWRKEKRNNIALEG